MVRGRYNSRYSGILGFPRKPVSIGSKEAAIGIEPMNKGFADLCLTTWLRRLKLVKRKAKAFPSYSVGSLLGLAFALNSWSGRRDLNPRLRPWQGRTLPLSYSRSK